jgi:hypothetical protein
MDRVRQKCPSIARRSPEFRREIRKFIPAGAVDEYLNDNQAPTDAVTANPNSRSIS